jgi:hypothetical protein
MDDKVGDKSIDKAAKLTEEDMAQWDAYSSLKEALVVVKLNGNINTIYNIVIDFRFPMKNLL